MDKLDAMLLLPDHLRAPARGRAELQGLADETRAHARGLRTNPYASSTSVVPLRVAFASIQSAHAFAVQVHGTRARKARTGGRRNETVRSDARAARRKERLTAGTMEWLAAE